MSLAHRQSTRLATARYSQYIDRVAWRIGRVIWCVDSGSVAYTLPQHGGASPHHVIFFSCFPPPYKLLSIFARLQIWTVILVARRFRLWYTVLSAMKGDTTRKPTRFELRLQKAMNPRCRKYNRHLPPPAPEPPPQRSNLQAVIEEIRSGDLAAPRRDPCIPGGNRVNSISDGLESAAKAAVWTVLQNVQNLLKSL